MNSPHFTKSGARLTYVSKGSKAHDHAGLNWMFLPGGPGLGSESLKRLTDILNLRGTMWLLDLPGDGSNRFENDPDAFSRWQKALVEAISNMDSVILVAHSTGGMYTLATPELEQHLMGLVLMDSVPNACWQEHFMAYAKAHPLPETAKLQALYEVNPSDDLLRGLTLVGLPYLCSNDCSLMKFDFLKTLPYNHRATDWSAQHFDQSYRALWIPREIPTLIFSGENDHLTPLSLFHGDDGFHRDNIYFKEIPNAGHFPWVENPSAIVEVFGGFVDKL